MNVIDPRYSDVLYVIRIQELQIGSLGGEESEWCMSLCKCAYWRWWSRVDRMAMSTERQLENREHSRNFLFPSPSTDSFSFHFYQKPKLRSMQLSNTVLLEEFVWGRQSPACRHGCFVLLCLLLLLFFPLSLQRLLFQHSPGNLDRNHLV